MNGPKQKFVWGSVLTTAALLLAAPARAQEPATVVLLDRNAIRANVAPNDFSALEINGTIADIGVRDSLPYFNVRKGQTLTIPGGSAGHEGWLVFNSVPASWAPSSDVDGLENFLYAGPGLGSPDTTGSRTSQLGAKVNVVPLGPTGLQQLAGRTVCAVAYSGELPRSSAGVTLSGANLGILAFSVVSASGGDATTLPSVHVNVLDTLEVCGGELAPLVDAPPAGQ